jgi:hypothetical protein
LVPALILPVFLPLYLLYRLFCTKENCLVTQQNTVRERGRIKPLQSGNGSGCTLLFAAREELAFFFFFASRVSACFFDERRGDKQQEAKQSIVIHVFSVNSISI